MEAFAKALAQVDFIWFVVGWAVILVVLGLLFSRSKKLKPYLGQLLLLSSFCLLTITFVILTFSFKVSKLATGATARTMPRVWAVLIAISALLTLQTILSGKEDPDEPFGRWKLAVAVIVGAGVCVALFDYIGYYLASGIFILVVMLALEERRKSLLIGVPVGWGIFTYFIFNKLLFITLPVGALFKAILG
jgi:putative tricarboxylic transport membrane protein